MAGLNGWALMIIMMMMKPLFELDKPANLCIINCLRSVDLALDCGASKEKNFIYIKDFIPARNTTVE